MPVGIKPLKANPEKRPLGVGVVEKIGITAIIRTTFAGKVQIPSYPVIFILEFLTGIAQCAPFESCSRKSPEK